MLNPLLHPCSNSAPTSPVCTRSIHSNSNSNKHSHSHNVQSILAAAVRQSVQLMHSSSPPRSPQQQQQQQQRRLSRLVKCRTMDFTEFPEGMREYDRYQKAFVRESKSQPGSPAAGGGGGGVRRAGMIVMRSPRITIQDYGGAFKTVGSKVFSLL